MKRKFAKTIASLLAVLMLLTSAPMSAFAQTDSQVTVSFTAFDGSVIVSSSELAIRDGTAEEYGYSVAEKNHNGEAVDSATFFDALVTAHKVYYGDLFTKETAKNYLAMADGYITKAFGKAASFGFTVNDVAPNDGVYNPSYGSYTGYSSDTAELKADDEVVFFFYQDTEYYMDYKAVFANDEMTANAGEALTVNVSAFCIWYASYDIDIIESMSVPADGVGIYSLDGTLLATTDENGNATVTFENAGEYAIYVAGTVESEEAPVIIDWATVTVSEAQIDEPIEPIEPPVELKWREIVWNWIVNAFNTVWTFITNLFGC